jgi:hypothetical protein
MTRKHAELLAKVLRLLNQHPRFVPGDRRLRFDSYTVAAEVAAVLTKGGYDVVARTELIDSLRR